MAGFLSEIVAQKNLNLQLCFRRGRVGPEHQPAGRRTHGAYFVFGTLIDHHVYRARGQAGARWAGQFVRNHPHRAGSFRLSQGHEHPGIARTDIVEPGQIGMGLQERERALIGQREGVLALDRSGMVISPNCSAMTA